MEIKKRILNLSEERPGWSKKTHDGKTLEMCYLETIFNKFKKKGEKYSSVLKVKCSCCNDTFDASYYGFLDHFPMGRDVNTELNLSNAFSQDREGLAKNINIEISEGNISRIKKFLDQSVLARAFKEDYIKGFMLAVKMEYDNNRKISLIIKKVNGQMKVFLFEININLLKVPNLVAASSYKEYIGKINIQTDPREIIKIKEGTEEYFGSKLEENIQNWLSQLFQENGNPFSKEILTLRVYR
jgi:hypothetical protein